MRIMLDPGHGGYDTGAIGPTSLQEKEVTLAVASVVGRLLVCAGQEVRLTRNGDEVSWPSDLWQDLQMRCELANNWPADYFVSIHCNAASDPAAHGTETYCYKFGGQGERLARAIQAELIQTTGLTDRGVKTANFYVLRNTKMPAVLTEIAFISNSQEEQLLADPSFQETCAVAIATGIAAFLGIQLPPSLPPDGVWINIGDHIIEGRIIDGRAWGPVRQVAELLGKTVRWVEEERTVIIES